MLKTKQIRNVAFSVTLVVILALTGVKTEAAIFLYDDYYIGTTHVYEIWVEDEANFCEPLGTVPYGPGACAYEVDQYCYYNYGEEAWGGYEWFDHSVSEPAGWSVDGLFSCQVVEF